MTQLPVPMRRMSPWLQAAPLLLLGALLLAPFAAAQSGGTGVGPIDDTYAYVEYTINNATQPDGNGTNPPGGNGTNPPGGNGTNPTNPPGNGTNPPGGNGTNPPGNGTNPPGNGTDPDGNETDGPDGNETLPGGNETIPDGNSTVPGNGTPPGQGNQTIPPGGGGGGGGANDSCTLDCAAVDGTGAGTDSGLTQEESGEAEVAEPCPSPCYRSRPMVAPPTVKPSFPWLPLLLTLTLAPLVGLLVARQAVKRWHGAPVAKKGNAAPVGAKGPADAHDPMRQFLMDVKEWRALPMPGSEAEAAK